MVLFWTRPKNIPGSSDLTRPCIAAPVDMNEKALMIR